MKKFALVILASLLIIGASAQNAILVSAYNYLRSGTLDKAKLNIDLASANVQTSGLAKCWYYRGNIYLSIYLSKIPKYKSLDTNALQVAYDSYEKAISIDKDVSNPEYLNPPNPFIGLQVVGEQFYNQGVDLYNAQKYSDALLKFEMTRGIVGTSDTIATFNAALCGIQLNDTKKAKKYLEELMKNKYHHSLVYSSLATIYKNEGDTVKALSTIQTGRKLMGDDLNLIIAETNIYLMQGKSKEAQDLLNIAVAKDPTNHLLHYAIGVNMAEFGNFDEAEKSYMKAIELKPDYFDAIYNLGALYVNTAASIMEKANALPVEQTADYDKLKAEADVLLNKAIPTLEKAETLQPNDLNTLYSLKQLYTRTNIMDKLQIIDAKIKELTKKP
jgi:tetratricopeptide (TPR) repeat protein